MTRSTDYHLSMLLITGCCGLGLAAAVVPGVERIVSVVLAVLAGALLLGQAVRILARWVRERHEDRADLAYATTVRATRHSNATAGVQG